jgi:hypothetical protein
MGGHVDSGSSKMVQRPADSDSAAPLLSEFRAAALRGLFPKLAPWRESGTERHERASIEAFLVAARDLDDLERRIGELQRAGRIVRR